MVANRPIPGVGKSVTEKIKLIELSGCLMVRKQNRGQRARSADLIVGMTNFLRVIVSNRWVTFQ